ncbi:MAG: carbon-phosphorus lyase complex subunit PhnI, partial [Trebonia sp.]
MGYSGVKGGMAAILAAERLVRPKREQAPRLPARQIAMAFRLAVDRIMGEAGLYDEDFAADAFRQAEGDLLEAAHLVRAHRSALPRLAVSDTIDPDEMTVLRRIVPASRTAEGPQLLGRTSDYTARLLERGGSGDGDDTAGTTDVKDERPDQRHPARFSRQLRKQDLLAAVEELPDDEPFDVTRKPARPPAPRSAILASMARAETGALIGLWYRSIRGPDGDIHEVTLGELRHGRLPLRVVHPYTGNTVTVGSL